MTLIVQRGFFARPAGRRGPPVGSRVISRR